MSTPLNNQPSVAIVLCTYNGTPWVANQVRSLIAQSWPVAIRVFDDGSSDDTVALIEELTENRDVKIVKNANRLGVVKNFSAGIQAVCDEGFEYIALCDQDDEWLPQRIEVGMQALLTIEKQSNKPTPLLIHSDLEMVNAHNQVIHASFMSWRRYRVSTAKPLATVLGQNGVMGNTILMNANMARAAIPFPDQLHVHDYWLAVVAELLGKRHYIAEPLVRYRIHDKNVSNSSKTVAFGLNRWFKGWSWSRLTALDFRLPFKEDTRATAVQALLEDERFAKIDVHDKAVIKAFLDYLRFKKNRGSLLLSALQHGFFRPGRRHKVRVIASVLTTRRYAMRKSDS